MPRTGADFWHIASFLTNRAQFWPEKTNTNHRKLKVTSMSLQSLVLLLRLAPSAVVMISGTHMHSSFENMTKTWQTPSTYKERHSWNRKFYFSEVCLWDTDTFKMISTSYTAGKFARAQKYFLIFFLVKTGCKDGKSATQRKQIWNYLFWLELYVLLGNMGREDSKHYLYAGRTCLFFLTAVSALLYCFMSRNFTSKWFYINLRAVFRAFKIPTLILHQTKFLYYCLWSQRKYINITK